MTKRNKDILVKAQRALANSGLTGVPLVVVLAMIKQEAPRQPDPKDPKKTHLSNTGDGLLQVTHESGNRGGQYGNTNPGVANNLADGLKTLKGFLGAGTSVAKAVSQYNGGTAEKRGDPKYTQHVAERITSGEVAANFGDEFKPDKLPQGDRDVVKALEDYKRPK